MSASAVILADGDFPRAGGEARRICRVSDSFSRRKNFSRFKIRFKIRLV